MTRASFEEAFKEAYEKTKRLETIQAVDEALDAWNHLLRRRETFTCYLHLV